jgi:hypothetical protein
VFDVLIEVESIFSINTSNTQLWIRKSRTLWKMFRPSIFYLSMMAFMKPNLLAKRASAGPCLSFSSFFIRGFLFLCYILYVLDNHFSVQSFLFPGFSFCWWKFYRVRWSIWSNVSAPLVFVLVVDLDCDNTEGRKGSMWYI